MEKELRLEKGSLAIIHLESLEETLKKVLN